MLDSFSSLYVSLTMVSLPKKNQSMWSALYQASMQDLSARLNPVLAGMWNGLEFKFGLGDLLYH